MMLDLDQIVIRAVREELDSDTQKRFDAKHPIIDYNFMRVRCGEITYNKTKQPSIPSAKVVYHAIYSNQTPRPQTYFLNTTRTTTAVKQYTFQRNFALGGKVNMPEELKDDLLSKATFLHDTKHSVANKFINKQKMIWSVDSNLVIPPNSYMTADLVVKEEEFNGDFSTTATFDGDIICYCPKKEKSRMVRLQDYYTKNILKEQVLEKEFYEVVRLRSEIIFTKEEGFIPDRHQRPTLVVDGIVYSKFGVEQEVCLTQFSGKPPSFETCHFQ